MLVSTRKGITARGKRWEIDRHETLRACRFHKNRWYLIMDEENVSLNKGTEPHLLSGASIYAGLKRNWASSGAFGNLEARVTKKVSVEALSGRTS